MNAWKWVPRDEHYSCLTGFVAKRKLQIQHGTSTSWVEFTITTFINIVFFLFLKNLNKTKLCSNILLLLMLYKNGTMFHVKGGLWNANYPRNSVVFLFSNFYFCYFHLLCFHVKGLWSIVLFVASIHGFHIKKLVFVAYFF